MNRTREQRMMIANMYVRYRHARQQAEQMREKFGVLSPAYIFADGAAIELNNSIQAMIAWTNGDVAKFNNPKEMLKLIAIKAKNSTMKK